MVVLQIAMELLKVLRYACMFFPLRKCRYDKAMQSISLLKFFWLMFSAGICQSLF